MDGDHGFEVLDFPYLGGMICGACCEVFYIGGEEDTSDVVLVGGEVCNWNQRRLLAVLLEVPNVDISLA